MTLEEVRTLYDFNAWANHRVLDACAPLTPEQFSRDLKSSFPSVRATLEHIMWAEWLWLERWQGRSQSGPLAGDLKDLTAIRARWNHIETDLRAYVHGLSTADLERVVEYRNTKGHAFMNPMVQMLQHLVNHGSYHRGQVTTMLRQLGAAPLTTDLIAFYRESAGAAHN
ncbi:MAG TPA: DinB family protein [Candidatus Acidoferrales bacterium]|nr:DinB family protein [Candidatus Acidoferrales bacterium]